MYIPEHFAFDEHDDVIQFARQNSFATLVSVDGSMPYATHLPLMVRQEQGQVILEGHMARANPHGDLLQGGGHLAVFQGPHAYVSPTWYRDAGVPTWNYVAVHMSGTAETVEQPEQLRGLVDRLAAIHERANPDPWVAKYAPAMLRAIVGFRIRVETVEGKAKLSQNRSDEDREGVIDALASPFGRDPDSWETGLRDLMQIGDDQ